MHSSSKLSFPLLVVIGFLAGFLGTITIHQLSILALVYAGLPTFPAYSLRPQPPFGVPLFVSLAFWAGIWGILYVLIAKYIPKSLNPLLAGALFGILLPTMAGWTIIATLKGSPWFFGGNTIYIVTAVIANGLWGASLPVISNRLARLLKKDEVVPT